MRHVYFLYFLLIFVTGIGTFSVMMALYHKTKARLLRDSLIFYIVWTLMVFFNTFAIYVQTNLLSPNPLFMLIFNALRAASIYLLIVAIPAFMHYLCDIPGTPVRNGIFAGLAVILFIGFHLFQYAVTQESIRRLGPYLEGTIFMGMMLYTIVTGFFACSRLQDSIKKSLAQKYLWLLLIFFPGIFSDMYLSHIVPIRIFPIFYGSLSVIFMRYFLSVDWQYVPQRTDVLSETNDIATPFSLAERCARYNITEREQEIIAFLLQGYSNPQIAEKLCISLSTVKSHLRNIYPKIGIRSRYELIVHFNSQPGVTSPAPENE